MSRCTCEFYDKLTLWATMKVQLTVTYLHQNQTKVDQGTVVDVYTNDKKEFIKMNSGVEIQVGLLTNIVIHHSNGEPNNKT